MPLFSIPFLISFLIACPFQPSGAPSMPNSGCTFEALDIPGSSSSFTAQFDDPFLGPGGMGTLETCFHGDDVAPEIGLGEMEESEPEATIDEIEDMDMMNALAATINGPKKPGCLPFFPWMKNKEDCRPKVHLTPQEKKRMRASVREGLYRIQKNKTRAIAVLCPTSSTKSNKNKSWSMRYRYSLGANKKKRRGGLASKFHKQQRGATLQVQAALIRLHRLLR